MFVHKPWLLVKNNNLQNNNFSQKHSSKKWKKRSKPDNKVVRGNLKTLSKNHFLANRSKGAGKKNSLNYSLHSYCKKQIKEPTTPNLEVELITFISKMFFRFFLSLEWRQSSPHFMTLNKIKSIKSRQQLENWLKGKIMEFSSFRNTLISR